MTTNWLPEPEKLTKHQQARLAVVILQKRDANPPVPLISDQKCQELRLMVKAGNEVGAWNEYLHLAQMAAGQALNKVRNTSDEKFGQLPARVMKQRSQSDAEVKIPSVNGDAVKDLKKTKVMTKQPVINAFEDVHWNRDQWNKYLASPPKWLIPCRVAKGTKRASATWNPVLIGLALLDRKILLKRLDLVFIGLKVLVRN